MVIVSQPLLTLLAGILILTVPLVLNYVIAGYVILIGRAGPLPHFLK